MTNLDALTEREGKLLEIVGGATGTIEERFRLLDDAGVFDGYRDLHRAYADLAQKQGELEPLKRALFIQWYALAEPGCYSGIRDLDGSVERQVFGMMDAFFREHGPDEELEWMLPYYYRIADFYLDRFDGFETLKTFSRAKDPELWHGGAPTRGSLEGRGQMGRYWLSIRIPRQAV